ncbi:MAG: hypothetical protein R2724_27430 [Bryobacterales bacterium]
MLGNRQERPEPQFTEEEIRAVVETAKDYGFVAAHAHGAEGMKRAIRAGVHSIEKHGTLMDDEASSSSRKGERGGCRPSPPAAT